MKAPAHIANYRTELCGSCKTPCEFLEVPSFRWEGDNACPINRWKEYKEYKKKGFGDIVEAVAKPIAGAIDAVAGTKLKGCGACARRRELLNQMFPLGK